MTFAAAFEVWMARRVIHGAGAWTRARYISPRSEKDLRQYARAAGVFFGELPLEQIHAGHLRGFQQVRALNRLDTSAGTMQPWTQPAGPNLIRKEVQTVLRVLRAAKCWLPEDAEVYEPLQAAPADVQRAMSPQEQQRWLHAAAKKPEWQVVYWYSLVALQTTASTNEMRALRLGAVFMEQVVLQVRSQGAKNKFRIRTIPLQTPEIAWALDQLVQRARAGGEWAAVLSFSAAPRGGDVRHDAANDGVGTAQALAGRARGGAVAVAPRLRSAAHGPDADGRGRGAHAGDDELRGPHQPAHAAALHRDQHGGEAALGRSGVGRSGGGDALRARRHRSGVGAAQDADAGPGTTLVNIADAFSTIKHSGAILRLRAAQSGRLGCGCTSQQ